MRPRILIWSVTTVALVMVALPFLSSVMPLAGIVQATRSTARFSGLIFAIALVARSGRPAALAGTTFAWTMAFVAAHGVHYGVIITRAFIEPGNDLRTLSVRSVLTVVIGFGTLALAAFTARATTGWRTRAHRFALYVLWSLFAFAFFVH